VAIALIVVLAGEAARDASWPWFAVVAVAALATAAVTVRAVPQGTGERAAGFGLALLAAAAGIAAGRLIHLQVHASSIGVEVTTEATRQLNEQLASSVAAATRAANTALDRTAGSGLAGPADLSDLSGDVPIESAVAVMAGDTVIAVAGPHRVRPVMKPSPAGLVSTPFARLLVIRVTRGVRQAQVILLLDSLPGLPATGPSLTAVASASPGLRWNWQLPPDAALEYPTQTSATAAISAALQPVAPPLDAMRRQEQRIGRLLVDAGVAALALLVLFTATLPIARVGAILLPLWTMSRPDGAALPLPPTVLRAVVSGAALLFVALLLWRTPRRRTALGMLASLLLLAAAAPLLAWAVNQVIPVGVALTLGIGFAWELAIALVLAGFLALAAAPLRAPDDVDSAPLFGLLAVAAALLVGLVGIEAWSPHGWWRWYPALWQLPMALLLPRTRPQLRLIAVATIAAVMASLATWSTSLDRRMDLAHADAERLAARVDLPAQAALDQLASIARESGVTHLDQLYAAWGASPLAAAGVPSYLAVWSGGHQRQFVALDSLSVGVDTLLSLVQGNDGTVQQIPIATAMGRHDVMILPLAADTVATIAIGPRSRLFPPTTFGLLIGWRAQPGGAPYTVALTGDVSTPADGVFRRHNRFVTADTMIGEAGIRRRVRLTVAISPPTPFVVRASLSVLLDACVILGLWWLLQQLIGPAPAVTTQMFRRSYRRTITTALLAFFMVPAMLFTLSSVMRLGEDSRQQHSDALSAALRDVVAAGGIEVADSLHPRGDLLGPIADSANAAIGIYRRGILVAASDPLLTELGLLPPVVDRRSFANTIGSDAINASPNRTGVRLGVAPGTAPGTLLVAALPSEDFALATDQVDETLRLLLATVGGILASVIVAGFIARALGKPIDTLRRTALAIGQRQPPPPMADVPGEFLPVFGAITQMQRDLLASEAELRAGRARTAAILSTVTTGVVAVDGQGNVVHINPRAAELLGEQLQLGHQLVSELPEGWGRVRHGIERLLERNDLPPESLELAVGGQVLAVTLAPLADRGMVLAVTDITAASRAARVLAWGEMARQVAHEIKNPLTPMRLGLQHLRRVDPNRIDDYHKLVDETAERLLVEIERLDRIARSFARYGAPPDRAAPVESVDLRAAVDELVSLFALAAERPVVEVGGDTAVLVRARHEELLQVLLNLLDNSRQAGASRVTLTIMGTALEIADNGQGIRPEQLARIFEPSFSTNTSGTGLGLAIVKRLVEEWDATIEVASEPGQGASFTVRFAVG
jgi:two-component system nitrogen regulation sensor histidine kinase NtrY